jgi:hypothetical protein
MQHTISNNDMNNPGEGRLVLDEITRKFLKVIFKALRPKDAIAISGSCVVALTLEKHGLPSFLPGDIDVFVKQNLKLEDQIFDRYFLHNHILIPLLANGICSQPKDIPIREFQKYGYGDCNIDILHIIEISLHEDGEDAAVNRPKIQIIIVADDSPTPEELPLSYLTPFERKVVTSFDIDIVQGAYEPNFDHIVFACSDTKQNILDMKFWYICDRKRPLTLLSAIQRLQKYIDRGFHFMGFRDVIHPDLAIFLGRFRISEPQP